ncbi:hypothetical protein HN51_060297 [Arachis hypogaea]
MEKGVKADASCFHLLFDFCGKSKILEDAKKAHNYFLQSTCRSDLNLNKVIEMYGNCKSMTDARRVFDHMPNRNMDSWHLMLRGYTNSTMEDDALQLFDQMNESGLKISSETFAVLVWDIYCLLQKGANDIRGIGKDEERLIFSFIDMFCFVLERDTND